MWPTRQFAHDGGPPHPPGPYPLNDPPLTGPLGPRQVVKYVRLEPTLPTGLRMARQATWFLESYPLRAHPLLGAYSLNWDPRLASTGAPNGFSQSVQYRWGVDYGSTPRPFTIPQWFFTVGPVPLGRWLRPNPKAPSFGSTSSPQLSLGPPPGRFRL
jgi:hypothetical protein